MIAEAAVNVEQNYAQLQAEIAALRAQLADAHSRLHAIATITPVPVSEAEVAPAMFNKLNTAMKIARATPSEQPK